MSLKVVLFVLSYSVGMISAGSPPRCGPGERFMFCGPSCPRFCNSVEYSCVEICRKGCYCKPGLVRGPNGNCIPESQCPPGCGPNQEYKKCADVCPETCYGSSNFCIDVCREGCSCKPGFVRDRFEVCIPKSRCPPGCGPNQQYQQCKDICPETCHGRSNFCHAVCREGCSCKPGFVRDRFEACIPKSQCPQRTMISNRHYPSLPYPNGNGYPFDHPSNELAPRQSCRGFNEIYLNCGPMCQPTCFTPRPRCPNRCKRGCFCRPRFLRGHDGVCILAVQCPQRG